MVEPVVGLPLVVASNQYVLPVLMYPMWTQSWPLGELQQLDHESRKILKENGGYHPMGKTDLLYLPRKFKGRGLNAVESTYKNIKVKTAIELYANEHPTMYMERELEEKCETTGRRSLKKDAERYALERGLYLLFTNIFIHILQLSLHSRNTFVYI